MKEILGRTVRHLLVAAVCLSLTTSGQAADVAPYWLGPMADVHQRFDGTPGYVAQFGDSITFSMAFWACFEWADPTPFIRDDGLPRKPGHMRWRDVIKGARAKGGSYGNYSGWRVGDLLGVQDGVLARYRPEVAIVMIGTNDISGGKVPEMYRAGVETVVGKCMDAGCVPILNTIPPRRGRMLAVEAANAILRDVARSHGVPLVDYCAEILSRRPDGVWDGTLISKDGVHPSGGKTADFSPENLSNSGYALRTWLNFLMFREVYFRILGGEGDGAPPPPPSIPRCRVPALATRPRPGAVPDTAGWAGPLRFGHLDGRPGKPPVETTAYLACDAERVYVIIRCVEPDMPHLPDQVVPRDGNVWAGDSVEVMLLPGVEPVSNYFQFAVNPAGSLYDAKEKRKEWNGDVETCVHREDDAWTVILVVPLGTLGLDAATMPMRWRCNLHRLRQARGGLEELDLSWSPTLSGSNHVPERFGVINLAVPGRDAGSADEQ